MRCSDCKRYKTKQCYINPSGKDLESAEYLTCFEPKEEELKEAPKDIKRVKEQKKKTNRLVWEIPLLVVLIVIAVLIWQKPDWFRVSGGISTPPAPTQHVDTQSTDTEIHLMVQYFNRAWPIIQGHSVMMSQTIDAVDEAVEKQPRFKGIHLTTSEEMASWLQASGARKAAINKIESSILKIDSGIVNFETLTPPDEAMVYQNLIISSFRNDQVALKNMLYYYTSGWEHGRWDNEVMERANRHLQQARLEQSEAAQWKQQLFM